MHTSAVNQFDAAARTYFDTASYGLPPLATVHALKDALAAWQSGSADWIGDWDTAGERCRPYAAQLLGSTPDNIALLPAASVGVAVAMATLDETDEVLAPDDEFASALLPAVVAASRCGARIRRTDFDRLADEVRPTTSFVVTSHVRSNDGRVQDLAAVMSAARAVGARVLVDATHSAGVLPVAADRLGLDYVVAAAYKHLLCPRGVAFLHVAARHHTSTPPVAASWRSAADPYSHYVGGDLSTLARTAARFDVSLAWHPWVGAEASLAFLTGVAADDREQWCVGLANELADCLGVSLTRSSVVVIPAIRAAAARAELLSEQIKTSGNARTIRVSCHLYNDVDDIHRAARILRPYVRAGHF